MDRTIPFLCCTILLILHTSSGSISRTAVGAFLEAIQREWNNCNHLPSNGELKNCIEDLQTVEDFNEDTIDEGRVVISRVCHKNISLVNLINVINVCNTLTFFRNISAFLLQQPSEVMVELLSLSFTDSQGEYKVTYVPSNEGSGSNETEYSNREMMTAFCIPDPRAEQVFISSTSSPKLLIILDLLNTRTSDSASNIEKMVNTIVSVSEDYIALVSATTLQMSNFSSSYSGLIKRANSTNIASLLNLTVIDTVRGGNGDTWVDHAAILNLLTSSFSNDRMGKVFCHTVLTVFINEDMSSNLVDTLLQASSTNLKLNIFVYNFRHGEMQENAATSGLPNVDRLLCEGRASYEDISRNEDGFRFLDILSFLAVQGTQVNQSVSWHSEPESHKACIRVFHGEELSSLLPPAGQLQVFAGLICLEMNSTIIDTPTTGTDMMNLSCSGRLPTANYTSRSQFYALRQIYQNQLSKYPICLTNASSQHFSPILNYTRPILSHLTSLLALSMSLVEGYSSRVSSCPRDSCFFSCSDEWGTQGPPPVTWLQFRRPFSYKVSSVFFVNGSLEEGLILDSYESEKFVSIRHSLCASSYLDDAWRVLTHFIPQVTFQYFDYKHKYVRSYPGYQRTNQSCWTRNSNDFPLPEEEVQEFFTSDLTGENSTRYCQLTSTMSDSRSNQPGMLCITIPVTQLNSVLQPVQTDPIPSQPTPIFDDLNPSASYDDGELTDVLMPYTTDTDNILSSMSNLATSSTTDSYPTPSPIVSEALTFMSEVECTLEGISKHLANAYQRVTALREDESCPYDNQLMDTCSSSCVFYGSGEDLCTNVFGECQTSSNVSTIYAYGGLHESLMDYNYTIDNLQKYNQELFSRLCTAQSLDARSVGDAQCSSKMLAMLPFSGYYVDAHSGFMSLFPDSDCSPHCNGNVCEQRNFDGRNSQLYGMLLVNPRDIYLVIHIENESNFDEMQRVAHHIVSMLPQTSLVALYFQSNYTTSDFSGFIGNEVFLNSNMAIEEIIYKIYQLQKSRNRSKNGSIILMTDSCLTRVAYEFVRNYEMISVDIFIYTFGNDCEDTSLAQEAACSKNGEWLRIGGCISNSDSECGMEQNDAIEIVSSYLKFYPTTFWKLEAAVWTEMGIEDSTGNENRTLSACVPVSTCTGPGTWTGDMCNYPMALLGIACIEFDRMIFDSLDGSRMALQNALNMGKMMLEGRELNDEERNRLRVNNCTMLPATSETPPTTYSLPPTASSPEERPALTTVTTPRRRRPRRINMKGGYVAAIVIGIVATISGSICVGYWVISTCSDYTNKKRQHYRSNDGEDDPFSTNYKRLHENMVKDEQEGL